MRFQTAIDFTSGTKNMEFFAPGIYKKNRRGSSFFFIDGDNSKTEPGGEPPRRLPDEEAFESVGSMWTALFSGYDQIDFMNADMNFAFVSWSGYETPIEMEMPGALATSYDLSSEAGFGIPYQSSTISYNEAVQALQPWAFWPLDEYETIYDAEVTANGTSQVEDLSEFGRHGLYDDLYPYQDLSLTVDETTFKWYDDEFLNVGAIIPDNNPTGLTSTISVPESFIVQNVRARVSIAHDRPEDLTISIIKGGTTVVLIDQASIPDTADIRFVPNNQPSPVYGGDPEEDQAFVVAELIDFRGVDAFGDWDLKIVDNATGEQGSFGFWEIEMSDTPIHRFSISKYFEGLEYIDLAQWSPNQLNHKEVELWVEFEDFSETNQTIIRDGTKNSGFGLGILGTNLRLIAKGSQGTKIIDYPLSNLNELEVYCIVCLFDQTNDKIELYINNTLVGSTTFTRQNVSNDASLGASYSANSGGNENILDNSTNDSYFLGVIDNVAVYDRIRTEEERTLIYDLGRLGPQGV